jgi:hypothetical protein
MCIRDREYRDRDEGSFVGSDSGKQPAQKTDGLARRRLGGLRRRFLLYELGQVIRHAGEQFKRRLQPFAIGRALQG